MILWDEECYPEGNKKVKGITKGSRQSQLQFILAGALEIS